MEKDREYALNIGIPNGILLTGLGILVLLTPVVHPIERSGVLIDVAAGLILIAGGCLSLYYGVRNFRR